MTLLNSKVLWWFLRKTGDVLRGGHYVFKTNYLSPFPCRTIDFLKDIKRELHDRLAQCAQEVLQLRVSATTAKPSSEREALFRAIRTEEKQVDEDVFGLHELDGSAVGIIEGENL